MASYHTLMMAIRDYRTYLQNELDYMLEHGGGWKAENQKERIDKLDDLAQRIDYL